MTRDEQWLLDEKYGGKPSAEFEKDKKRLAAGEPLAYIIGWQPFLGLKIHLDSKPLIPRTETEWWAEQMLASLACREVAKRFSASLRAARPSPATENRFATSRPFRFLDLCAGSGAIGCAVLAELPDAHVYFGEIDPAHEATISKNIRENNLDASRAEVRIGDLFEPFVGEKFDVIAANPPYIPSGRTLNPSVTDHEPALALFGGNDGLDLIRRIALTARRRLAVGGQAWIEVDSARAAAACALFTDQGFAAEIRTDQYGKPRVIVVSFS